MQIMKRRLTDLWIVGKELTLDDGEGGITVWMQKMNPMESADTSRRCDAARARMLMLRHNKESAEYLATMHAVLDYGDDPEQLIAFLALEERARSIRLHEARNAADDEWAKDNYLQGLRDAWDGGLGDVFADNPEDEEAKRVLGELKRFDTSVTAAVDHDQQDAREIMATVPINELRDRMVTKLMEMDGNQVWLNELHRCQIYFSTREEKNHKTRYFTNRDEVDDLSTVAYTTLRDAYENLEVDAVEGKDLRATPASSLPQEPLDGVATADSSGLVAAAL